MPATKLPRPVMGMGVEELTDLMFRYYRELEYVLGHLDSENVREIDADVTEVKNLDPTTIIDNTFITENIVTNTLVTNTLYANYARIAQLTVDELSTGWEKITNYLISSTADVNYLYIHDQTIEFITASTDGLSTEQAEGRDGNGLYWTDATHTGVTDVANAFPVTTYVYAELKKAEFSFADVGGVYLPQLWLGAGTGANDNGKSCVWKGTDGLYLDYYHSVTGELLRAKITDDGLDFGGIGNIIYDEDTLLTGTVQLFVGTDFPAGAKANDVLIDTDDYSRYDHIAISTNISTDVTEAEFIEATGSTAITLTLSSTSASAGCIKKIKNSSSAIVTLSGTIDGGASNIMYPFESCELIWNGTDWRMW